MTEPTHTYLQLKVATAAKLGQRAKGGITYAVLADADKQALYLTITANSGGGYFSRDIVPMATVERCLPEDTRLITKQEDAPQTIKCLQHHLMQPQAVIEIVIWADCRCIRSKKLGIELLEPVEEAGPPAKKIIPASLVKECPMQRVWTKSCQL